MASDVISAVGKGSDLIEDEPFNLT